MAVGTVGRAVCRRRAAGLNQSLADLQTPGRRRHNGSTAVQAKKREDEPINAERAVVIVRSSRSPKYELLALEKRGYFDLFNRLKPKVSQKAGFR